MTTTRSSRVPPPPTLPALLAGLALLACPWTQDALAHGLPRPVHGGSTATQLDLGFEIFRRGGEIVVYVTDHDSPFATDVFSGHVELGRELVALRPAPGGLLVGTTTSKRPDLRKSVVVLKARVLPAPLRIDFAAPPP
jgi:hypothetical protein